MTLKQAFEWLQSQSFPTEIRESNWLFPTIETVHVLALVLVVGSVVTVDLRLLGLANRARPVTDVTAQCLPLTWWAFLVAAIAGSLLFTSKAVTYYNDIPFRIKMVCMALAAVNVVFFNLTSYRRVAAWDLDRPPAGARLAGGLSLLLWVIIVGAGRWIGFTT
jgi:uncharacterized protein DUF6644